MGSATALYAAIQSPQRIKALVTIIPPTAWEERQLQQQRYKRLAISGGLLGGNGLAKMMSNKLARLLPPWMIQAEPVKAKEYCRG